MVLTQMSCSPCFRDLSSSSWQELLRTSPGQSTPSSGWLWQDEATQHSRDTQHFQPTRGLGTAPMLLPPSSLAFCSDLAFHLLLHPRKSIRDKPKLTLSQEKYFCALHSAEVDCMAGTSIQMKSYRHPLVHPAPIPQKTK